MDIDLQTPQQRRQMIAGIVAKADMSKGNAAKDSQEEHLLSLSQGQ
jgi:hypothetical protein